MCPVAGVSRYASRPACSVVGESLRWQSAAGMEAMAIIQRDRGREWNRPRTGRPRQRWEAPLRQFASDCWWTGAAGWKSRKVVTALTRGETDGMDDIQPD